MKKCICLVALCASFLVAFAQETMEKTLEKRSREMFRVIQTADKSLWRTFVSENYSQSLIDKPMTQRRNTGDESEEKKNSATTQEGKIDEKAMMFARLNEDFGSGTLTSVKTTGETCVMSIAAADGLTAIITLKAESEKPYLLKGFGVEAKR